MKDRNMNQWVEGILADKKRIAIPIMTHPGIELIGKTVYQAVSDGRVHFEAIKALNDKYPSPVLLERNMPCRQWRFVCRKY